MRNSFGEHIRIESASIVLTPDDKDSLRSLTKSERVGDTLHLLLALNDNQALGYAVVDNAKGKDQPITYCVMVDTQLTVRNLEILAYREPYGGEIQNSSWRKQFFGKHPEDTLRPGKEIKNITGATISVRSVTMNVKKVLSLLSIVKSRLPYHHNSDK